MWPQARGRSGLKRLPGGGTSGLRGLHDAILLGCRTIVAVDILAAEKGYQSAVQINLPAVDHVLLAIEFDIKHTYLIMSCFPI